MHDNNSKSSEQIQRDLKRQYQLVEEAILHLNACKQQVDQCTYKAKEEVRSGVNGIMDQLRQREVQLLRQIDVIQLHYGNTFHVQNAKLHQMLGTLKHVIDSSGESRKDSMGVSFTVEDMQFRNRKKPKIQGINSMDYSTLSKKAQKFIEAYVPNL